MRASRPWWPRSTICSLILTPRRTDRLPDPLHECENRCCPSESRGQFHRPGPPVRDDPSYHQGPVASDKHVPQFLVTNLEYSSYVGQIAVGRLSNGTLEMNKTYSLCGDGSVTQCQFSACYTFQGLKKISVPKLESGISLRLQASQCEIAIHFLDDDRSASSHPDRRTDISMIFYVNRPLAAGRGSI